VTLIIFKISPSLLHSLWRVCCCMPPYNFRIPSGSGWCEWHPSLGGYDEARCIEVVPGHLIQFLPFTMVNHQMQGTIIIIIPLIINDI